MILFHLSALSSGDDDGPAVVCLLPGRVLLAAQRGDGALRLRVPALAVSEAVVITADRGLRARLAGKLPALQAKLRAAGVALD